MGVTLLGNMKIHEIAKKLNVNSKEVLERAKKLGLDVKSHLSAVNDEVAKKILDSFQTAKNENSKVAKKEDNKKDKNNRTCNYQERSNYYRG